MCVVLNCSVHRIIWDFYKKIDCCVTENILGLQESVFFLKQDLEDSEAIGLKAKFHNLQYTHIVIFQLVLLSHTYVLKIY